jgi:hypothetical protein
MPAARRRWILISLTGLLVAAAAGSFCVAEEQRGLDPDLQGKWSRQVKTATGVATIIKDHLGDKTILTAYDDQGKVMYAHESKFECETSGRVKVFTILQRKITAGPGAGQVTTEKNSFVYRIVDDKFIEVRGVLEEDPNPPGMVVWKRVKDSET